MFYISFVPRNLPGKMKKKETYGNFSFSSSEFFQEKQAESVSFCGIRISLLDRLGNLAKLKSSLKAPYAPELCFFRKLCRFFLGIEGELFIGRCKLFAFFFLHIPGNKNLCKMSNLCRYEDLLLRTCKIPFFWRKCRCKISLFAPGATLSLLCWPFFLARAHQKNFSWRSEIHFHSPPAAAAAWVIFTPYFPLPRLFFRREKQ